MSIKAILTNQAAAIDATPQSGSPRPVSSGGVDSALGEKQNTLTFDTTPTENSSNPVTSGGVFTALSTAGGNNILLFESENVPVNSWVSSQNQEYNYQATISLTGVTVNHYPLVTFDDDDVEIYGLAQEVVTGAGTLTIYADTAPLSVITIKTISCYSMNPGTDTEAMEALLALYQRKLTFDTAPTSGSNNPVTSGGIFTALENHTGGVSTEDLANYYVWGKYTYSPASTSSIANSNVTLWSTSNNYGTTSNYYNIYQYSSSITIADDGSISLDNPTTVKVYKSNSSTIIGANNLVGKYFFYLGSSVGADVSGISFIQNVNSRLVYYCPSTGSITSASNYNITMNGIQMLESKSAHEASVANGLITCVVDLDDEAYPNQGRVGNYWYVSQGRIGYEHESGSYIGTGAAGVEEGVVEIHFDFTPSVVFLNTPVSSYGYFLLSATGLILSIDQLSDGNYIPVYSYYVSSSRTQYYAYGKFENNTLYLYDQSINYPMVNCSAVTYNWVAIG